MNEINRTIFQLEANFKSYVISYKNELYKATYLGKKSTR